MSFRGPHRRVTTPTSASTFRYCLDYYSWFLRNSTLICRRVKRVSHSHSKYLACWCGSSTVSTSDGRVWYAHSLSHFGQVQKTAVAHGVIIKSQQTCVQSALVFTRSIESYGAN